MLLAAESGYIYRAHSTDHNSSKLHMISVIRKKKANSKKKKTLIFNAIFQWISRNLRDFIISNSWLTDFSPILAAIYQLVCWFWGDRPEQWAHTDEPERQRGTRVNPHVNDAEPNDQW